MLFIYLFILFYSFFLCCLPENKIWQEEEDQTRVTHISTTAQRACLNLNEWAHKNLHLLLCDQKTSLFPQRMRLGLKFVCLFPICRDQWDQACPWTAGGSSAEEGHSRCGRHEAASRRSSWTLPAPPFFQNHRQGTAEK